MRKIWYLSSCSTCAAIIKALGGLEGFEKQDIKQANISAKDLDWLKEKMGTYEALFSRRALKFREWGLHEKKLAEQDYRDYILQEYTFLKRPVIVDGGDVFVGNTKAVVEAAQRKIGGHST